MDADEDKKLYPEHLLVEPREVKYPYPKKVGIDLDGTILRNDAIWAEYFNGKVGSCHSQTVESDPEVTHWGFWDDICKDCIWSVISSPAIVGSYIPYPDSFDVLNRWFNRGTQFYVITSRPKEVEQTTKDWLAQFNFLPLLSGVYFAHDKWELCNELGLDYFLDDAPRNITEIGAFSKTIPVMFLTRYNEYINNTLDTETGKSIHIKSLVVDEVHSWIDFNNYLENKVKENS